MKTKKKRRRRTSKVKVILPIALGTIIVLAVALYLSQPPSQQRKPAQEYFRVLGSTVDIGDFPNFPDTSLLMIRAISFNITAVGGDAHGVVIESIALSEPQLLGDISQGQIVYVNLAFGGGLLSEFNEEEQGFPVTIRIRSMEASGELTFYIPF